MNLRIGGRKVLGLLALVVVAILGLAVWSLWGTNGLLFMVIITSLGSALVVVWFVQQAERRTARRLASLGKALTKDLRGLPEHLNRLSGYADELASRGTWDGERAERFLSALDGRLTRTERMLEALMDRLDGS